MTQRDPTTLTPKENAFCDGFVLHGNASKAARDAGYTEHRANAVAWVILRRPRVQARISELRAQIAERSRKKVDDVMVDLETARQAALQHGNLPAAIRASELQGKQIGMFKEQVELTGKDGAPIQVTATDPVEAARQYQRLMNGE
jgi:phage terminase small subunit